MIYAGIFRLLASSTNVDCIKTDQSVCSDLSLIKVWNSQNFNLLRLWHFPFSKNRINTSPNGLIYFFFINILLLYMSVKSVTNYFIWFAFHLKDQSMNFGSDRSRFVDIRFTGKRCVYILAFL